VTRRRHARRAPARPARRSAPRPASRPGAPEDRAAVLRSLRELRRLAHRLRQAASAPLVERVAQIVETECHLALWALGEVRDMTPEAENVKEGSGSGLTLPAPRKRQRKA
jgi:hypothetical protein